MTAKTLIFVLAASTASTASMAADDGLRLRLRSADRTFSVRPDGTDQTDVRHEPASDGPASPDGRKRLRVVDGNLIVADADGRNPRTVARGHDPHWSPDGRHFVFTGEVERRPEVFRADAGGTEVRRLGEAGLGSHSARYLPDGRIAWLERRHGNSKAQPSDLVVWDGKAAKRIVENTHISDFACSPDGKTLAYGIVGSLVFHDLATGKSKPVPFQDIHERLYAHGAGAISWRPDGKAVACRITFLGGRTVGTVVFGDGEVFVIPVEGRPTWFGMDKRLATVTELGGSRSEFFHVAIDWTKEPAK